MDRVALTNARALNLYGVALVNRGLGGSTAAMDVRDLPCNYILLAKTAGALDHPLIKAAAEFGFGPATFADPARAMKVPDLKNHQPWRDSRNSLSDLLFEKRAF